MISFDRLCNDGDVCRDVIRLGGVDRLVELCKDPSERNYSDAVLVACLAVIRRVKNSLEGSEEVVDGIEIFSQLTDLVHPKLVDSFLEYSAKQESYV